MKICRTSMEKLMNILFNLAAILYGCGTLLAFINAVCRKFLSIGFAWGEELTTYLIVMGFFLAIPYLELHDGPLCINLLDTLVKNNIAKRILYILRGIFVIALCVIIVRYGFVAITAAISSDLRTFTLRWPKAIFYSVSVAGFILSILSWITILLFNKGGKIE